MKKVISFNKMLILFLIVSMLEGCLAGNIRLNKVLLDNDSKQISRDLVIEDIVFRYDDPWLQESSHFCLWTLIPGFLYRENGRNCNGDAFITTGLIKDSPELIPKRIKECIKDSLQTVKVFNNIIFSDPIVDSNKTALHLKGEIKECREVGYGTVYGLSLIGAGVCMVIPVIPTNYGNHIKFAMELELYDPVNKRVLWKKLIKGETKHRTRFFWQVRDIVHGTNDFDEELSNFLQPQLAFLMKDMISNISN
jgi:hypothetical protein